MLSNSEESERRRTSSGDSFHEGKKSSMSGSESLLLRGSKSDWLDRLRTEPQLMLRSSEVDEESSEIGEGKGVATRGGS